MKDQPGPHVYSRSRRLGSRVFDEALASHPAIASAARLVFEGAAWRVRDMPARLRSTGLHADWMPRAPGSPYMVLTAIWMLDDFTVENGATRVVPRTHAITAPIAKRATSSSSTATSGTRATRTRAAARAAACR